MLKTLAKHIGQYKKYAILTPILTAGEVLMEILIPFVTAMIIDRGIQAGSIRNTLLYGAIMLALAFVSLYLGISAGKSAAKASTGFSTNLRQSIFENIQTFSFSNIDKFSTAGLVTRMTTDVTSIQNAFQVTMRIAVRLIRMHWQLSPRMLLKLLASAVQRHIGITFG